MIRLQYMIHFYPCSFESVMASSSLELFRCFGKGVVFSSQTRQIVINVYSKLKAQNPSKSIRSLVTMTSELTGVGKTTIYKVKSEVKTSGKPCSPSRKREGAVGLRNRLTKYNDFELCCIRRKVHQFYLRNEIPTARKVLCEVNNDEDLPNFTLRTFQRLLKNMGFEYRRRQRNSALIDREDLIIWRRKYLRAIRQLRKGGIPVYFLDETWVNAGHTKTLVWQDTTIWSSREAFFSGLSTGLKAPSGKGGRLIIVHAGNENGFVEGALHIFHSKTSKTDYHEEMDGNYFENWFKTKLLPNILPNSVIVMDNAPYHSIKLEKLPTTAWKKCDIQAWLSRKGISWLQDSVKAELLQTVHSVKHKYDIYKIDCLAASLGHSVLRLPPYHCELNPIEMVWSQVKGYVAAQNKTFKLNEVERLCYEAISRVTPENWRNYDSHVQKTEGRMWELDGMIDENVESLIITDNFSSTDTADEESEFSQ